MIMLGKFWRRIMTSRRTRELEASGQRECALKEEFARRAHALESQILLLRAENRALLNSVLGIAGIPPIIVTNPAELPYATATPREVNASAAPGSPVGAQHAVPGADTWHDDAHPANVPGAALPPSNEEHDPPGETSAPNSAALPSTIAGHSGAMPLRKQHRNAAAANDGRIVAPMRRRSWHQIYRTLELESSRRKAQDS
jgi:hypothetical protein